MREAEDQASFCKVVVQGNPLHGLQEEEFLTYKKQKSSLAVRRVQRVREFKILRFFCTNIPIPSLTSPFSPYQGPDVDM